MRLLWLMGQWGRVCELLLGGPPLQKEGKSLARMRGEVPTCSGNVRGAAAMHEGDGQVAQGSHESREPSQSANGSDLRQRTHRERSGARFRYSSAPALDQAGVEGWPGWGRGR